MERIKALQEESGGFGALLMLTLEWTSTEKWYRSLELFARYVMPQFNGSLRGLTNSYERMVKDVKQDRMPSARSEKVIKAPRQSARRKAGG